MFVDTLGSLKGTGKAVIINKALVHSDKISVKDLARTIPDSIDPTVVIFDGLITQRLVEIAIDKGIKEIYATKIGNIPKKPTNIKMWTKGDFE